MGPAAARAPAPRVHGAAGSHSACVLHALGCALDVRPPLGAADGRAILRESLTAGGPLVELTALLSEGALLFADETTVLLGHQAASDDPRSCPACTDDDASASGGRALRLAAVAVARDPFGRVLLTRRPASMRTFPGAWVLPGGAVDAGDASVVDAALRELREETGIEGTFKVLLSNDARGLG
ncbi:NUDIX hydrolase domain-like protein [Pavlovales sp. CCMP2436]|nr:NUDIX hydrolase domain-like protein [Pavlovales sp. CCMP2436]